MEEDFTQQSHTLGGAQYFSFRNTLHFRVRSLGICFIHLHRKNLLKSLKRLLGRWRNINRKLHFFSLLSQIPFGL